MPLRRSKRLAQKQASKKAEDTEMKCNDEFLKCFNVTMMTDVEIALNPSIFNPSIVCHFFVFFARIFFLETFLFAVIVVVLQIFDWLMVVFSTSKNTLDDTW